MKGKNLISAVFVKAQCSSVLSTFADFALTFLFTKLIGFWYLFSSCLGTIAGGGVNFLINRFWVFKSREGNPKVQMGKYTLIWLGNLSLNSGGVYLLTDVMRVQYLISKTIVAISIGVFYNYYFQKTYVFQT
jgi:putative flippase GtrA